MAVVLLDDGVGDKFEVNTISVSLDIVVLHHNVITLPQVNSVS
jgi:hypothetical protein